MTGLTFALRKVNGAADASLPAALIKATPKRRAEYFAGRHAAQTALRRLNGIAENVGMGADRLPVWPNGVTGSISHNRHIAAALVASKEYYDSVGIDVETLITAEAARDVKNLIGPVSATDPLSLTIAFSAKESLFKALYPFVGFFGFDAAIFAPPGKLTLTRDLAPSLPAGRSFEVRHRIGPDCVMTWIALQARSVAPPSI